ncbi:MAG: trimethylamine methyltransferase family protein [Anaerolineales bacterium]|nr:trimethylamine methyltransferase family protein [Anaerolineales bacterium]
MSTETPPLTPIKPAYHLCTLGNNQLDHIQSATLEVLEQVGVHCPSEKALQIYAEHGGQVDFERQIVRLPASLVMKAIDQAPRFYTMGARQSAFDLRLDGSALYCATDGCGVETIDFLTRERRPSKKEDTAAMARVADYLGAIGFYWPIVSAQDFPTTAPLHELDAAFNNTVKHVQSETVMGEPLARYAIEMARVVAGDESTLRQRPPLSLLVCAIAPLAQDKDGLESALLFAQAGLPVGFMSMVNTGSTAPATLAGTLVTGDAEIISALALIQMACPGAAVFHSLMPGIMHPRTGAYLGTAWEGTLLYVAGVEMAHHWGLPTLAGVFGTDAQVPGWQAAGDAASSLLLCALAGAETGAGLGLLESCTLLYPEAIVLDADIHQRVRLEAGGLDTSSEMLALDVIKEVGPRGHFLRHKHTRTHLRRRQFSDLTTQPLAEGGYRDPLEAAREKVAWILENHHPQPLEPAQQKELEKILQTAEKELAQ